MRTTIDSQGCNTVPGLTGLEVKGDLIVGSKDLLKEIAICSNNILALTRTTDEMMKLINELQTAIKAIANTTKKLELEVKELKSTSVRPASVVRRSASKTTPVAGE